VELACSSVAVQLFTINFKSSGGLIFYDEITSTSFAAHRAVIKAENPKEPFAF